MRLRESPSLRTTLLALALATGCASPPAPQPIRHQASAEEIAEGERLLKLGLDRWLEREVRLQRISQQLRLGGRELCRSDVAPVMGFAVAGRQTLPEVLSLPAAAVFPDDRLRVIGVFPGMAAEAAGLRVGDVVLAFGRSGVSDPADLYLPRRMIADSIVLRIAREGQELELRIANTPGCAYLAVLAPVDDVNAATLSSFGLMLFPTGLLRAIPSDRQLAFMIGHEMGHALIRRGTKLSLDSYATENEADYIGAYLAVRAGFALDAGDVTLFDAVMLGDVKSIDERSPTHPMTPARAVAFAKTLEEIEQKRRRGEALVPFGAASGIAR